MSGLFGRLRKGLARSARTLAEGVRGIFSRRKADASDMDRLEELLLSTDMGVRTAVRLRETAEEAVRKGTLRPEPEEILRFMKEEILAGLTSRKSAFNYAPEPPTVVFVVGVNGVGKTTTVGKLAAMFREEGKSVTVAACDTFRAAAVEQLEIWAERSGAGFFRAEPGQDPSAVLHNAALAARSKGTDILLVDTAGRLHTKENLMRELDKMRRVADRVVPGAPHETFLVLDATTGQNALAQARTFSQVLPLSGLIVAKLDGTAKGGVALAIFEEVKVPIRYVGTGEKINDLAEFSPRDFVEALFSGGEVESGGDE